MAHGHLIDERKIRKKRHIVALFRDQGALSKAQARKLSGYSMETVIGIFSQLESDGYIEPCTDLCSDSTEIGTSDVRTKGRPAELYNLCEGKELYYGLTFHQTAIHTVLVSLNGVVIDRDSEVVSEVNSQAWFLQQLEAHAARFLLRNSNRIGSIKGVALSLPGRLDRETGILRSYTLLPWLHDLDLAPMFQKLLPHAQVSVQHNIAGMASCVLRQISHDAHHERILFVSARSACAHALIQDGQILFENGEMGHMTQSTLLNANLPRHCRCGRLGCLDTVFSSAAFMDKIPDFMLRVARIFNNPDAEPDETVQLVVMQAFPTFIAVLADLLAALNPDRVVLSGELFSLIPDVANSVRRSLDSLYTNDELPVFARAVIRYIATEGDSAAVGLCRYIMEKNWEYRYNSFHR